MTNGYPKPQLWLCIPVALAGIFDVTLTLLGQSTQYWFGGYHNVDELNPFAAGAMTMHPLMFVLGTLVMFGIYIAVITALPLKFSKILSLYLTMAHTYGGFSWLKYTFMVDYWIRFGILIIPATILIFAFYEADFLEQKRRPVSAMESPKFWRR
jgi:hypothetical protein